MAVPVTVGGRVIAALNVGTQAARVPMVELRTRLLPPLRRAAIELAALGTFG